MRSAVEEGDRGSGREAESSGGATAPEQNCRQIVLYPFCQRKHFVMHKRRVQFKPLAARRPFNS